MKGSKLGSKSKRLRRAAVHGQHHAGDKPGRRTAWICGCPSNVLRLADVVKWSPAENDGFMNRLVSFQLGIISARSVTGMPNRASRPAPLQPQFLSSLSGPLVRNETLLSFWQWGPD
jgi:hypothetical protein